MKRSLAIAVAAWLAAAGTALANVSSCDEKLSELINALDTGLQRVPNGPVAGVQDRAKAMLPIADCSPMQFKEALMRSKYYLGFDEANSYYIGTLLHRGAEVGISLRKKSGLIDRVYVKLNKYP